MFHRSGCLFRVVLVSVVLFAGAASQAGYKQVNASNADDPMSVRIFELDNGLRVYLTENHEKPRFYAEVIVRAGSMHDPAETTGLAHYLEHLLFKGNRNYGTLEYAKEKKHLNRVRELYQQHFYEKDAEKRKAIYEKINAEAQLAAQYAVPNELDSTYKAMGGTGLNAHTSVEETVYKVNLPANRLRQWAVIESDRFIHPVFRLFHTELETVYEEKNRSMDNKMWIIYEAVGRALFKKHPYGQQTTLGEAEHLKKPSLVNIRNFYNKYYIPNNMAICISGDIDIDEAIKIIDKQFGKWERKKLPKKNTWREEAMAEREQVTVKYKAEEYLLLAFRTASQNHEDADVLSLMDMVLSNSEAGLIDLNLNQKQKVRSAGSYAYLMNDYSGHYLVGIPKKNQSLKEVEKLLLDQIEIVKKGEFEDWILPAIINDIKKSKKARLESNGPRGSMMRGSFLAYQDWDYTVGQLKRLEKITRVDIVRVANKYYGAGYVAGYRVDEQQEIPSITKPKIDKIEIDAKRQSGFMKMVLAMPVKEIEPVFVDPAKDYKVSSLRDGVQFYYAPNPLNDLFSLSFVVDIGSRQNNRIGMATRLLDKSGTGRFTAEELKKEWYKLGSSFGANAGRNETRISIYGLDENFEASVGLAMELLKGPEAKQETLDELIRIVLVQREDRKKDPHAVRSALVAYNYYGQESDMLQMLPGEEVRKLTVDELGGIIKGLLGYEHTVSYTGSLPAGKVMAMLKKHYSSDGTLKKAPDYKMLTMRKADETEIMFFDKEMAQSLVTIGFGDEPYNEKNYPASQLYNSYFSGGMGGIVFQELREARGLAYTANASYIYGRRKNEQNAMYGFIGTQADKTSEAVEAFFGLFDDMPITQERFDKTVGSLVNQYRTSKIGFRSVIGAVRGWEKLGLKVDPRKERYEKVRSADMETMLEFYRSHIKSRAKLLSIVGDKSRVDTERLGKSGKITMVGLDQIFVD